MNNIRLLHLEKYDSNEFDLIDNYIYRNLKNGNYCVAISFELENDEDTQNPLEDILEKYSVNITDFFEVNEKDGVYTLSIEIEGSLCYNEVNLINIKNCLEIIGKRVHSKTTPDGFLNLVIE